LVLYFYAYFLAVVLSLVVSVSAVDCPERLIPEIACHVSGGTFKPDSVIPCLSVVILLLSLKCCVLCLTSGTKRFDSEKAGDREVQRTMLELLNQLDGFQPNHDIKVEATLLSNDNV